MPELSNGGRLLLSIALKSTNHAAALPGGIAANRSTSSGCPPKPARFRRWRACSGVQSDAPIGDRSSSQASLMARPPPASVLADCKVVRYRMNPYARYHATILDV